MLLQHSELLFIINDYFEIITNVVNHWSPVQSSPVGLKKPNFDDKLKFS